MDFAIPLMLYNEPTMSEIFLGRKRVRDEFRETLLKFVKGVNFPRPYVTLLYGNGGIGKTSLSLKLLSDLKLPGLNGNFQAIYIDWQEAHRVYPHLHAMNEVTAEAMLDALYQELCKARPDCKQYFHDYEKLTKQFYTLEGKVLKELSKDGKFADVAQLVASAGFAIGLSLIFPQAGPLVAGGAVVGDKLIDKASSSELKDKINLFLNYLMGKVRGKYI